MISLNISQFFERFSTLFTGGSAYDTEAESFPAVPFGPSDFNDYRCDSTTGLISNYGDPLEVRNCRLVGLMDLDHSNPETASKVVAYMNDKNPIKTLKSPPNKAVLTPQKHRVCPKRPTIFTTSLSYTHQSLPGIDRFHPINLKLPEKRREIIKTSNNRLDSRVLGPSKQGSPHISRDPMRFPFELVRI